MLNTIPCIISKHNCSCSSSAEEEGRECNTQECSGYVCMHCIYVCMHDRPTYRQTEGRTDQRTDRRITLLDNGNLQFKFSRYQNKRGTGDPL